MLAFCMPTRLCVSKMFTTFTILFYHTFCWFLLINQSRICFDLMAARGHISIGTATMPRLLPAGLNQMIKVSHITICRSLSLPNILEIAPFNRLVWCRRASRAMWVPHNKSLWIKVPTSENIHRSCFTQMPIKREYNALVGCFMTLH